MTADGATGEPREATPAELADWDRRAVGAPGGHVYQSRTWAEQRARVGWQPLHLMLDDDHPALVLLRPFPLVGGASAYVPRGPIAAPDDDPSAAARRVAALAEWLAGRAVDVLATDAEIPAADPTYGRALRAARFKPISRIQPSRHRVSITLPADADDAGVRTGLSKSTRQRVNAAESEGLIVTRYDTAGWDGDHPLFEPPSRPLDEVLGGFATLLEGTGQRRGFRFGPLGVFLDWWTAGHAAGLVVYLEARDDAARDDAARDDAAPDKALGGLLLYRHGRRLSTVHSADAPGVRDSHPGVMHLLRWRAIQLAIREGRDEMDLGGVDVGPDHTEPAEGDPMAGLYEHKRSFGAGWVEMTGAHERVMRPWHYAAGRVAARVARLARR